MGNLASSALLLTVLLVSIFPFGASANAQDARGIARKTLPSVVLILTKDSNDQPIAQGSGFFVRPGLIATNWHVVDGATKIEFSLNNQTSLYGAVLQSKDEAHDVALLKIVDDVSVPSLVLGDSGAIEIGESVFVVGNPKGLTGSISAGLVSGIRVTDGTKSIQFTAAISSGSSGGPVLDENGAVIGIAEATLTTAQNVNFAVPVSYLKSLLPGSDDVETHTQAASRDRKADTHVLAQLGTVVVSLARINTSRTKPSRLLSSVGRGTDMAVIADGGLWWGVLMVNGSIGWIPKSAVELRGYRVTVPAPKSIPTVEAAVSSKNRIGIVPWVDMYTGGTADAKTSALLRDAFRYLGVRYMSGSSSRRGIDDAAFVVSVYNKYGVHLPRSDADQARFGRQVHGDDLRPADRLYFDIGNRGKISHSGIYAGNGYFIHASSDRGQVVLDPLLTEKYRMSLVCAVRDVLRR